MNNKAFFNWSSGKDSMLALHKVISEGKLPVKKLLTTINRDNQRVTMHGLHEHLLQQQADCLGIPLTIKALPSKISLPDYNQIMEESLQQLKQTGFTHGVFGDILLEDLKDYRHQQYKKMGLHPVFPLWKKDTSALIEEFIALGYKAVVVCVNARVLDSSFCGRVIDREFIKALPKGVDPCGENGEFHSFVFDGPLFENPVKFKVGKTLMRDYQPADKDNQQDCFTDERSWDTRFWFTDLKPI